MTADVRTIVESFDAHAPLAEASTIPASWYVDPRLLECEQRTVFGRSWQLVGRAEQVRDAGQFVTAEVAGEPIVAVRGGDGVLRAFFNVCRHHAAAVAPEPEGRVKILRCPYHGWTYSLEGELKGTPDFAGVCNFDRAANGLVPIQAAEWEKWIFVNLEPGGATLLESLGADLVEQFRTLSLERLQWHERRRYTVNCNWKVYVDNYLDGGYHVPHLHKELDSVLDYKDYTIETGARHCLQSSPIAKNGSATPVGEVRRGDRACYFWLYPNLMVNWYDGVMDTNLVTPLGIDRTEVNFDFYFADISSAAAARNRASLAVSERIQDEDVAVCEAVQRGLRSRAYQSGRLSVRREAGERLFHQLLYADLKAGLDRADA